MSTTSKQQRSLSSPPPSSSSAPDSTHTTSHTGGGGVTAITSRLAELASMLHTCTPLSTSSSSLFLTSSPSSSSSSPLLSPPTSSLLSPSLSLSSTSPMFLSMSASASLGSSASALASLENAQANLASLSSRHDHHESHFLSPEAMSTFAPSQSSTAAAVAATFQHLKQQQQSAKSCIEPGVFSSTNGGTTFASLGASNTGASLLDLAPGPFGLTGAISSKQQSQQAARPPSPSHASLHLQAQQLQHQQQQQSSLSRKKQSTRDPLSHRMIEKRRRDRMNNCLTDLSRLIPNSFIKKSSSLQNRGRIEKTEIIEMAIKYLKYLQNVAEPFMGEENRLARPISPSSLSSTSTPSGEDQLMQVCRSHSNNAANMLITNRQQYFRLGYQEAITDVVRFFEDNCLENLMSKVVDTMQEHLEKGAMAIVKKHMINGEDVLGPSCRSSQPGSPYGSEAPQDPSMADCVSARFASPSANGAIVVQPTAQHSSYSLNAIKGMLVKTLPETDRDDDDVRKTDETHDPSQSVNETNTASEDHKDEDKVKSEINNNNSSSNSNNSNSNNSNNNSNNNNNSPSAPSCTSSEGHYSFKKEIKDRFEKLGVFNKHGSSLRNMSSSCSSYNSEAMEEMLKASQIAFDSQALHTLLTKLLVTFSALLRPFSPSRAQAPCKEEEASLNYVPVFVLHPSKDYYVPMRIESRILGLGDLATELDHTTKLAPFSLKGIKRKSQDEHKTESLQQDSKKSKFDDKLPKKMARSGDAEENGAECAVSLFPINITVNIAFNRVISLSSVLASLHESFNRQHAKAVDAKDIDWKILSDFAAVASSMAYDSGEPIMLSQESASQMIMMLATSVSVLEHRINGHSAQEPHKMTQNGHSSPEVASVKEEARTRASPYPIQSVPAIPVAAHASFLRPFESSPSLAASDTRTNSPFSYSLLGNDVAVNGSGHRAHLSSTTSRATSNSSPSTQRFPSPISSYLPPHLASQLYSKWSTPPSACTVTTFSASSSSPHPFSSFELAGSQLPAKSRHSSLPGIISPLPPVSTSTPLWSSVTAPPPPNALLPPSTSGTNPFAIMSFFGSNLTGSESNPLASMTAAQMKEHFERCNNMFTGGLFPHNPLQQQQHSATTSQLGAIQLLPPPTTSPAPSRPFTNGQLNHFASNNNNNNNRKLDSQRSSASMANSERARLSAANNSPINLSKESHKLNTNA